MSSSDLALLARAAGVSPAEIADHAPLLAAVREAARQGAMEGRRIGESRLVTAAEARARLRVGADKLEALRKAGEIAMFRLPDGAGKVGREWYTTDAIIERAIASWQRRGVKVESRYRRKAA